MQAIILAAGMGRRLKELTQNNTKCMVKVNGVEVDIAGKTVSEYLATTNYDPKRIAVERNGDIVFKSQYDATILEDGDSLEIVSFVGGG